MRQWILGSAVILLCTLGVDAQVSNKESRTLRLSGAAASSLISIVSRGNAAAQAAFAKTNKVVIHDLAVVASFNADDPEAVVQFQASGTISDAKEPAEITTAEELSGLFTELGIQENAWMRHSSYELVTLTCDIRTTVNDADHYHCDLITKYGLRTAREPFPSPQPQRPDGLPVTETTDLGPGTAVYIEWEGMWWEGSVNSTLPDGRVRIHYTGWSIDSDDNVPRSRLILAPVSAPPPGK
jgi:hypothetical protein